MGYWDRIVVPETADAYRTDYAGWAFQQARLVRELRPNGIDVENVAEELESLGKQQHDTLESVLGVILLHMLKWDYQPMRRGVSWLKSVAEHRRRAAKIVRKNPSLKPLLADTLTEAYADARADASFETGLPERAFPSECPYTWDAMMTRDLSYADPA